MHAQGELTGTTPFSEKKTFKRRRKVKVVAIISRNVLLVINVAYIGKLGTWPIRTLRRDLPRSGQ